MQNRFNFRVWSVEQKKMYRWFDCIKMGPNFIYGMFLDHRMLGKGSWCIQQSTGLKDNDGKLAYFDDLIKLDNGLIAIIKQITDLNSIDYGRIVAIPICSLNKKYQTHYMPTVIFESEIIGNIYENPELLEEKQC